MIDAAGHACLAMLLSLLLILCPIQLHFFLLADLIQLLVSFSPDLIIIGFFLASVCLTYVYVYYSVMLFTVFCQYVWHNLISE